MGLFELIGDLVLEGIMSSDTKVGNVMRNGYNHLSSSANTTKQRLEMDARIRANNSKNKERDSNESKQGKEETEQKYKPITIE